MSSDQNLRPELLSAVSAATQQLGTRSTLLTGAVAERLGINATDFECLDLLGQLGPITAGQLAEASGLTTGAVTGVIDRLEQAGFVQRLKDAHDRRKVIIEVIADRLQEIGPLYHGMALASEELFTRYSDQELATILDFTTRATRVLEVEAARLRLEGEPLSEGGEFSAPLAGATNGRLVFASGAAGITIGSDPQLGDLYRASFAHHLPSLLIQGSTITVQYRNFPLFNWLIYWRAPLATMMLNGTLPWALVFRGGVTKLAADLRALRLESITISGGVSASTLKLPRPDGAVALHIGGGASDLHLGLPAGVGVGVHAQSGLSNLSIDDQRFAMVGSPAEVTSIDYQQSSERYDITIGGGANNVQIRRQ
jgi:DNA-binding MarR family transcriptional regulator